MVNISEELGRALSWMKKKRKIWYPAFWEESFTKIEAFGNTIKDAFEHLINLRLNQPAELIAKFVDEKASCWK